MTDCRMVISAVRGNVLTGLGMVRVMMIGQAKVIALIHHLEKSRTIAKQHVAIVMVSNVLNKRKDTSDYDTRYKAGN